MSEQLTDMQNNLALVLALEDTKILIMKQLAKQFKQAANLFPNLNETADAFIQSAEQLQTINDGTKKLFESLGLAGNMKDFLDNHQLKPLWAKK